MHRDVQEEKAKNPSSGNVILGNAAALAGLKLHIGNLHQNITEDDLGEICRSFGEVRSSCMSIPCVKLTLTSCSCALLLARLGVMARVRQPPSGSNQHGYVVCRVVCSLLNRSS